MQLTYRGVPYINQLNKVQLSPSSQTGVYRGQTFSTSSPIKVLRFSLNALNYRGINYTRYATFSSIKSDRV